MAGLFFIDAIRRRLNEKARLKRVQLAAEWPLTTAEVNSWKVLPVAEDDSHSGTDFLEAGFSFRLNGEYYGGYLRSIPMTRREAERLAMGSPKVQVRYNPANPDETAVLAEDNAALPFEVLSS